jgi:CDP-glycerol glycerophosphotransferase (TagB/SpsB family)
MNGRRLVLYAPTFREKGPSALTSIDAAALAAIKEFCTRHNVVFGIRSHPYEADQQARSGLFDGSHVIDLGSRDYAEPNLLLRHCSAMIVDYSSIWVDFLLLRRPVIGFVPDMGVYSEEDRGFIYDHRKIFPGPICENWGELINQMENIAEKNFAQSDVKNNGTYADILLPSEAGGRYTEQFVDLFFSDTRNN